MTETWLPVVGFEGLYEVSSEGRVRSLSRPQVHYTGKVLMRRGRELAGCVTARGYAKVTLCRGGKPCGKHVHSLVAAAFIGPRPAGLLVRHLDGNGENNRVGNLAYGSGSDNIDDMRRRGTLLMGESHGSAKLTEPLVRAIRAEPPGLSSREIGEKYGISTSQAHNVRTRRAWRHL